MRVFKRAYIPRVYSRWRWRWSGGKHLGHTHLTVIALHMVVPVHGHHSDGFIRPLGRREGRTHTHTHTHTHVRAHTHTKKVRSISPAVHMALRLTRPLGKDFRRISSQFLIRRKAFPPTLLPLCRLIFKPRNEEGKKFEWWVLPDDWQRSHETNCPASLPADLICEPQVPPTECKSMASFLIYFRSFFEDGKAADVVACALGRRVCLDNVHSSGSGRAPPQTRRVERGGVGLNVFHSCNRTGKKRPDLRKIFAVLIRIKGFVV